MLIFLNFWLFHLPVYQSNFYNLSLTFFFFLLFFSPSISHSTVTLAPTISLPSQLVCCYTQSKFFSHILTLFFPYIFKPYRDFNPFSSNFFFILIYSYSLCYSLSLSPISSMLCLPKKKKVIILFIFLDFFFFGGRFFIVFVIYLMDFLFFLSTLFRFNAFYCFWQINLSLCLCVCIYMCMSIHYHRPSGLWLL